MNTDVALFRVSPNPGHSLAHLHQGLHFLERPQRLDAVLLVDTAQVGDLALQTFEVDGQRRSLDDAFARTVQSRSQLPAPLP